MEPVLGWMGVEQAQFKYNMEFQYTREFAKQLDQEDGLRSFRSKFIIPMHNEEEAIYFLGNSLGLQPKETETALKSVAEQWRRLGVEAFFKGEQPWLETHSKLKPALAKVVGAKPQEVVAMNSLTVNLHLMLVSFYQPKGKRTKILCEAKAFPSDQYMLATHVRQRGFDPAETIIEVHPPAGEVLIREEDIAAAIARHKEELALVFWGGVNYYTGQVFNMEAMSDKAHEAGAMIGLDLAHAVGNIPLQLHDWNIDFACWCSYKYLNSGPGGIGGAFIHERFHQDNNLHRFAGWWGNKKETQFLMENTFAPELSAEGWQLSTPSPFLYALHHTALKLFEKAGLQNSWNKNRRLNSYLWEVLKQISASSNPGSFCVLTPGKVEERGCQVSLRVRNGKKVFDYLAAEGIYADWREPDVIRIAPTGLYNTFEEVFRFGECFKTALHKFAE